MHQPNLADRPLDPRPELREEILQHMARAFFACAWADYSENVGPHYPSGCEIMNAMPDELDPAAVAAAGRLAERMEKQYGKPLSELMIIAQVYASPHADRRCNPEFFGHYAAMQAMGSGVGLECVCDNQHAFPNFPYMEFSMYDLDAITYPIPEEGDED